jgi:hypothetical protein
MTRHYERVAARSSPSHGFGGDGLNQWLDNRHRARKAVVDAAADSIEADLPAEDCRAEIARLQAVVDRLTDENARLTEENRAFVSSVRHMTSAAEEVLADARREAAETRARVAAEAYERLIVARADARAAVFEERERTAAELELLAAVRERLQAERSTLSIFQDELSGRLRDLVAAVFDFEDRTPSLSAGPSWEASAATIPQERTDVGLEAPAASSARVAEPISEPTTDISDVTPSPVAASVIASTPERYVDTVVVEEGDAEVITADPGEEAEEELEAAFAAFFHADIEGEPSRHWILDGR